MSLLQLQSLTPWITARMLNSALEGIALTALVWALLRLLRRQNSGTRFAIWMMALLAVVSLPFFAGANLFAAPPLTQAMGKPPADQFLLMPPSWAVYLFAAWGMGAAILLLRLGAGLWRLRRLRARCTEADPQTLDPAVPGILHGARGRKPVPLILSHELSSPAVIGFFRPAIVFPAWLLPQLSTAEMEIILLHELAHLRRRDPWTNLFQKVLKALFFFHPAVWWIEGQLTLEREMACDDVVLEHRASPRDYASVLISLAEKLHSAPAVALAQALLSRMREMSLRVSQILDANRPVGAARRKPVLGAGVALLVLAVGAAPYAPRLVGFRHAPPPSAGAHRQAAQPNAALAAAEQPQTIEPQTMRMRSSARPIATLAALHNGQRPTARLADSPSPDDSRPPAAQPEASPATAIAAVNASPETPVTSSAIRAAYHARQAALPLRAAKNLTAAEAAALASNLSQSQTVGAGNASPATYVIVQTTMLDASGSPIWTLCIWRVEGGGASEQLESAIALAI